MKERATERYGLGNMALDVEGEILRIQFVLQGELPLTSDKTVHCRGHSFEEFSWSDVEVLEGHPHHIHRAIWCEHRRYRIAQPRTDTQLEREREREREREITTFREGRLTKHRHGIGRLPIISRRKHIRPCIGAHPTPSGTEEV